MDLSQYLKEEVEAKRCEECTKLCAPFTNHNEWYCPHCHISYVMTQDEKDKIILTRKERQHAEPNGHE